MNNKYDDVIEQQDNRAFRVVEHFISINGEGRRAGQLALFIRFAGCNLRCDYCDTLWANDKDVPYESYIEELLIEMIAASKVKNVTLTGGEPLIQPGMKELLGRLRTMREHRIEIETNGSVDITEFFPEREDFAEDNVTFTVDYKTGASGMEQHMCMKNFESVRSVDTVKFVVGDRSDIEKASEIIKEYSLVEKKCGIYISPCFGLIEPVEIADYLVKHRLNDVNVQLQLHKYIWNPDARGV